ncbi:hypothetical protein LTR70_001248 [Exophiala xenobiotica]|uniref:Enoyl reductase (ER) domain-containing protein n=1 Tax=Lithohypha guttulata TaxID=1690604 RepID=A0ABR0KKI8_9EURO|nr:hypothetical protein LTR24_001499 [Lithohypha guttulata]KAK5328223.1 hypothetical protein LTR70_001248 [Exophiala xenobiotica]
MVLDGSSPIAPSKPVTVGHEACGEIVDLGPAVTGFSKGDKVGFVNAYHACWECAGCARHYGQCESGDFVMQGWGMDGFMQEYCIVDYRAATVLPDALDASKAAPLFCAGITAYNAVRTPGLKEGQWLAVIGCGGLGQMAVRYAKASGLKVVAVDIDDETLAKAKQAGVEHTFNSRSDPNFIEELRKVTSGGADAVAVFTAVKAGYDVAPKTLKLGGKLVCVGCPPNEISVNALHIALGMYSVLGASNHAKPAGLRECADFTVQHGIECPIQFFGIDQIGEMIDLMQSGKMGGTRLVVRF